MAEIEGETDKDSSTPRPRIQSLSDFIFGLALSIGAITLLSSKPSNLEDLGISIAAFGFSFLILALVWLRYTTIMSVLPVSTGSVVSANLVLLFLVSIEPYLFSLISFAPPPGQIDVGTVTSVYAIDLGLMNLVLAYFSHTLAIEGKRLMPKRLLRNYRLRTNLTLVSVALFPGLRHPSVQSD